MAGSVAMAMACRRWAASSALEEVRALTPAWTPPSMFAAWSGISMTSSGPKRTTLGLRERERCNFMGRWHLGQAGWVGQRRSLYSQ
eukprot:272625-Pyramimonas_sp.AAC.1